MSGPRELLQQLLEHRDLTQAQAESLLVQLADPQTPPALAGALLVALSSKGVVAQELRGLAQAMRRLARRRRP
jgi:anthranilate phosphoribosyltransferase